MTLDQKIGKSENPTRLPRINADKRAESGKPTTEARRHGGNRRSRMQKNLPLITTGDTDRKEIGKRKGFQNGINAERRSRRIEAASAYIFYNFQRHPTRYGLSLSYFVSPVYLRIFMQSRNFSIRMLALLLALLLTQPFALATAQAQGTSSPTLPDPGTPG